MEDERRAFLAAIAAAPDDPLPKSVYADWLDEHGEPDAAAFYRGLVVECPECSGQHACWWCEGRGLVDARLPGWVKEARAYAAEQRLARQAESSRRFHGVASIYDDNSSMVRMGGQPDSRNAIDPGDWKATAAALGVPQVIVFRMAHGKADPARLIAYCRERANRTPPSTCPMTDAERNYLYNDGRGRSIVIDRPNTWVVGSGPQTITGGLDVTNLPP